MAGMKGIVAAVGPVCRRWMGHSLGLAAAGALFMYLSWRADPASDGVFFMEAGRIMAAAGLVLAGLGIGFRRSGG